ncbi:MAG: hypothetical protein BWX86_00635 [Verrucomicrobia bacterium ADurb.Bin122]|nr:MAG: hypothetical protein BWX86_00635 [Verrucomicrobia bacterium ADurb.Bin122]
MVKEQIDEILLLAEDEPVLAADEAKTVAQFQDEALHLRDKAILQVALLYLAVDAEEFEAVTGLECFLGLLREGCRQRRGEVVGFAFRERALVGAGFDLVEQYGTAPAEASRGLEVIETGSGVFGLVENEQVMAPGDFCDKLPQKLIGRALPPMRGFCGKLSQKVRGGISGVESAHIPEVAGGKAPRLRKG